MQVAIDGVELEDEDPGDTAASSALAFLTEMPNVATRNLMMTHYMIWKQDHSMSSLNGVASELAALIGTTYSYTPLP
jgi:hypothetical protein